MPFDNKYLLNVLTFNSLSISVVNFFCLNWWHTCTTIRMQNIKILSCSLLSYFHFEQDFLKKVLVSRLILKIFEYNPHLTRHEFERVWLMFFPISYWGFVPKRYSLLTTGNRSDILLTVALRSRPSREKILSYAS